MTYRSDICKCEFVGRISPPESEVGTLLSELYAASFNLSLLHLRFEFALSSDLSLGRNRGAPGQDVRKQGFLVPGAGFYLPLFTPLESSTLFSAPWRFV
jgi:hypothetical protein